MSEPTALYIKLKFKPGEIETALHTPSVSPNTFSDWGGWLDKQQWHGKETTQELVDQIEVLPKFTLGSLSTPASAFASNPPITECDETENIWECAILEYSENYGDMLRVLALVRSIAQYTELNFDSYAILLPYYFGPDPKPVAVKITDNNSTLYYPVSDDMLKEVTSRIKILEKKFLSKEAEESHP